MTPAPRPTELPPGYSFQGDATAPFAGQCVRFALGPRGPLVGRGVTADRAAAAVAAAAWEEYDFHRLPDHERLRLHLERARAAGGFTDAALVDVVAVLARATLLKPPPPDPGDA
jgi:hypothetical protein